jgi:putative membrane protein
MDDTLIPNAKNADLKALLEKGKPIFTSHLDHAKEVQSSLK